MKTKQVNVCTVQTRTPEPAAMLRYWSRDRIVQYLDSLPDDEKWRVRAELNGLRGK